MATTKDIGEYSSDGTCSYCDEGSVATLRIEGEDWCLSCIREQLTNGRYAWRLYNYDEFNCAECGDRIDDGENMACLSCADKSELHGSDDCDHDYCHDDCTRSCPNCGHDSPDSCEHCLLCTSCNKPVDDELPEGKVVVMHEKCFEEVKQDAETLVAAEPGETYEVSW
jgi:hypothetical protein